MRWQAAQRTCRLACAVDEDASGGRRFHEAEHPYRSCFQRDRDRVIHCSAFRRLDFKTQVFVPHEQDHFRTRLTHTIEVAQIARDLSRAIGANEDLAEVVALAHDLGHPPFGHAGEAALDALMSAHGGFEHNRQSLRVVDYLEHPYPEFRGLNLTNVVRECLARHETRYDRTVCEDFPPGMAAPLEGQIVDLADEIAWTSADVEDALGAGLLSADRLDELELWRLAWQRAGKEHPRASAIHRQIRATKGVLAILADDAIATTRRAVGSSGAETTDDVRRAGEKLARLSADARRQAEQLQQFMLDNVYLAGENARLAADAEKTVRELFTAYVEDPALLPERYRRRIGRAAGEDLQRVACDYVAGMTDRFCQAEHRKLTAGR
jgi:dGTPase